MNGEFLGNELKRLSFVNELFSSKPVTITNLSRELLSDKESINPLGGLCQVKKIKKIRELARPSRPTPLPNFLETCTANKQHKKHKISQKRD